MSDAADFVDDLLIAGVDLNATDCRKIREAIALHDAGLRAQLTEVTAERDALAQRWKEWSCGDTAYGPVPCCLTANHKGPHRANEGLKEYTWVDSTHTWQDDAAQWTNDRREAAIKALESDRDRYRRALERVQAGLYVPGEGPVDGKRWCSRCGAMEGRPWSDHDGTCPVSIAGRALTPEVPSAGGPEGQEVKASK